MKKILRLLSSIVSLFYPRICLGCGDALQGKEAHLCLDCVLHLPETNYHLTDDNPLMKIFLGRAEVEHVFSFLFYRKGNAVQTILHSLKYKGNKEVGYYLGRMYGEKLAAAGVLADTTLILPIPLHPKKLKIRGYNQSEWIAKGLGEGLGIPYTNDCLVRSTFTETQTKKTRFKRWENVQNVFEIADTEALAGKHVIVCDDVLTTGATTEAAIQKILACGNVRVSVVTLATAQ